MFFHRKLKQIYSKYLPSLVTHFSHLSGNLWIPRQKIPSLSRQTTYQAIFGRLHKNRSAAQQARAPSTKTGGSRKGPGLVNKRLGVDLADPVERTVIEYSERSLTVLCPFSDLALLWLRTIKKTFKTLQL